MANLDLMIAGAQKSGTTSLLRWLGTHPGIAAQRIPEMTWFTDAELSSRPFPDAFYFGETPTDGRLRLGKLAGLMYSTEGIDRLVAHSPKAAVIVVLRNPVERAYASFWFARRRGRERARDFEGAIGESLAGVEGDDDWSHAGSRYLDWSCYAPHVEELYDHLGRRSVHVIIFEELISDGRAAITPALEGCGLDVDVLGSRLPRENSGGEARSEAMVRARRSSPLAGAARRVLPQATRGVLLRGYRRLNERSDVSPPPMSDATRTRLEAAFAGPNKRLETLLGRPIEAWAPRE